MTSEEEEVSLYAENSYPKRLELSKVNEEISKSETVILKAITHRGTQTLIQCDPNLPKEDFINMLIKTMI